MLKLFNAMILLLFSLLIFSLNFYTVFIEDDYGKYFDTIVNIRYDAYEHDSKYYKIETKEIKQLISATEYYYREMWLSKFYHIIISFFCFSLTIIYIIYNVIQINKKRIK